MKKTIINYANGDKYEGGLKGKRKHGYGIFTWADGSTFKGDWKDDKKHGHATFIDASGEELSGYWKNGKFEEIARKRSDKKIDLKYLKKNLNLKIFIKLLNKTHNWGNDPDIYYNFLKSCKTSEINDEQLFDEINGKLYEKFEDQFVSGEFLPTISDNFKLIKSNFVSDIFDEHEEKSEYWIHQVISSKINKIYYIVIYQGYDTTNDGYYVHKKFKDKKKALNYIKDRKDKIWKKYKDTFTKEIKNKKF